VLHIWSHYPQKFDGREPLQSQEWRGSGFGVRDPGFGIRVSGSRFPVPGFGLRVPGSGVPVPEIRFGVKGLGV